MEKVLSELDKIVVSIQTTSDNYVVVRTEFPAHSAFGPPARAKSKVNLQYTIHVPRQTRIIVRHESGEVKVHDVAANVDVIARSGGIQLDLPESERFIIDAHARQGEVISDWASRAGDRPDLPSPYRVTLRVECGDISIRKTRGTPVSDECSNG
jgi:hypothetical protein